MSKYDCVVIGCGPAGVSAALYLNNANKKVLVIGTKKSSLDNAEINNFYGYINGSGKELFNNGIEQLKVNKIEYWDDEVVDIQFGENGYEIKTKKSKNVSIFSVVFALGNKKNINSKFAKYLGKGLSVCAHCDAPLHKNKTIYYTGEKDYLDELKNDLSIYSKDLIYLPLEIIQELSGEHCLTEIKTTTSSIQANILFYATGISTQSLLYKLGLELDKQGFIKVDENYKTNLPHIYACGDCISGVHQVASAVYTGMMCGLNIIKNK